MALPTYNYNFKPLPTYTAQRWNEGEIDTLTQKRAAPGLRALRQQIQRVGGMSSANPNVKRMTLRDALAGYGSGVSSVMGSAGTTAAGEYGRKFGATSQEGLNAYKSKADATAAENAYNADIAGKNFEGGMAEWGNEQDINKMGISHGYDVENMGLADKYATGKMKYGSELDLKKMGVQNNYDKEMKEWMAEWETKKAATQNQYDIDSDNRKAALSKAAKQYDNDAAWDLFVKQYKFNKANNPSMQEEYQYGKMAGDDALERKKILMAYEQWLRNNGPNAPGSGAPFANPSIGYYPKV